MIDNGTRKLQREEHEAWLALLAGLEAQGVITSADRRSPMNTPPTTPGLIAMKLIREWGTSLAALMVDTDRD